MDFAYVYSDEQERFRAEVRAWLEANVAQESVAPRDPESIDDETYAYFRGVHRALGEKGWLHPTYPAEYGGGGLTAEHETVLVEELARGHIPSNFSNNLVLPSILVWGTEEQKQRFLPGLLRGETVAFQTFSEPQAGSDLAAVASTAVRDGDSWVLNGQKIFITGLKTPTLLYGPFVTDPTAPRHQNLGYFLIPVPSGGLSIEQMVMLNGPGQKHIFFDNVRVPANNLIGGETEGWQVSATTLEQEHGGRGAAFVPDQDLEELLAYVRTARRNERRVGEDPLALVTAVDAYIDSEINRLLHTRNYWMYVTRQEMTYHGPQSSMWRKEFHVRNATREREIMGPDALLDAADGGALYEGAPEVRQRRYLAWTHPGGTPEIMRLIMARRLGLSRTRERAAPTPSTATGHTG